MRKILYISGTRADYGLMRRTLFCINRHPRLRLEIAVTGMHLMPKFGKTIDEIRKDNFKIHEFKAIYSSDDKKSVVKFIVNFLAGLSEKIESITPDIILILGDRAEMLVAAILGSYLTIPVVHIHGGEVTSTVDEITRHAITKLSHIHLVATKKSAQRIIRMGEDRWRVHTVGAPSLDTIFDEAMISKDDIAEKYNLDLSQPIILVIQHALTAEICDAGKQMVKSMEAIKDLKFQSIVIYPNADPGAKKMIKVIEKYRKYPFIQIYKNISYREYLSLMGVASVLVGNSSSGIIEAPSFHLPVVNIGRRQEGRERAGNILDVDYDRNQIKKAIKKAIYDKKFKAKVKNCISPYSNGRASEKIVRQLSKLKIEEKLLHKKIAY